MRFVRILVRKPAGTIELVMEQETPFPEGVGVAEIGAEFGGIDLGLVEDFEPTDLDGAQCSPSHHLFLRIEGDGSGGVRAKAGAELPVIQDCPTSKKAILDRLVSKGATSIPPRAAHWREFMGAFSGDEMNAAGLPRLPITTAAEFDAMRMKRDPSIGSRLDRFKRTVRARPASKGE
jgi:hypothetical protein